MSASLNCRLGAPLSSNFSQVGRRSTSSSSAAGSRVPGSRSTPPAAGLSVALLERRDLAHGTSRWSSKLVHGGLRYLAQGDVGLAYESAVERGILLRHVAPHLMRPIPFLTPLDAAVDRRSAHAACGSAAGSATRCAWRPARAAATSRRRAGSARSRRAGSLPRCARPACAPGS